MIFTKPIVLLLMCCWIASNVNVVGSLKVACKFLRSCFFWRKSNSKNGASPITREIISPPIHGKTSEPTPETTPSLESSESSESFKSCESTPEITSSSESFESVKSEYKNGNVAVFQIQDRNRMENTFAIHNTKYDNTGVSLFAIFDGHHGKGAAEYAAEKLLKKLDRYIIKNKIETPNVIDYNALLREGILNFDKLLCKIAEKEENPFEEKNKSENPDLDLSEEEAINEFIIEEYRMALFGKARYDKKKIEFSGTTALIGLIDQTQLYVASVGDSRGVMCDESNEPIKLCIDEEADHIQLTDQKGNHHTLETWKSLGDYTLKRDYTYIADPSITTFDLRKHRPKFLIFASKNLWNVINDKEAVDLVLMKLQEPLFGAKDIALQATNQAPEDEIIAMVINLSSINVPAADGQ